MARRLFPNLFKSYDAAYYRWWYRNVGHQKFGLRLDDLWDHLNPDVEVAISRLSEDEYNMRNWRLKRALDLSMKNRILPLEQWTKPEDDHRYILKHVVKIREERLEREAWNKL
ncbi:Cytochrome b-c1 complex subunit 7-like [Oopsacas minuta]|uniref:Cytochrome b-c1 complex subunit 7 n=1 Tax=Oopsacas minuta TaxID=111878 RepID=A0AAV7K2Y3_9METZ|nr:Cytochrome b-c1 complex subunit 7-like [Oopsacas minuta]